jgi:hypothetical protein
MPDRLPSAGDQLADLAKSGSGWADPLNQK